MIAKSILWNNSKLRTLDEDETRLEEDLETLSELHKSLFDLYDKEKCTSNYKDNEIATKKFRRHSFVQKYLERRKNLNYKGKIL